MDRQEGTEGRTKGKLDLKEGSVVVNQQGERVRPGMSLIGTIGILEKISTQFFFFFFWSHVEKSSFVA